MRELLVTFGLGFPFIGFLILMLFSHLLSRFATSLIGCTAVLLSFICFCVLTFQTDLPLEIFYFSWISTDTIHVDFKLTLDHLSLLMALIITGVGLNIHIYSIGYMEHEKDIARYFSCLNFFVFAMLLLVLASNLLLLFVGWEGVGLASYLLIGFWYQKSTAAQAATKAFIVNRIGDFGFLLGIIYTFYLFGTSDMALMMGLAGQNLTNSTAITILTILLFIGAIGKSAQLPLHVWLPDAMEGPTPVSALIHAATMVTAGIYLVVRLHPLFLLAPNTLFLISLIGASTALYASLSALGQMDLKRVLAYSTVSQLGLMFLACGVGAFYAAMFHLTMHAFIKALLFLSAGNVIHELHGTNDMEKMGGLAKIFKKTNLFFLIGVLALSGIPPLAAFFSKDLILEEAYFKGHKLLFAVGLISSILTAFYLTRAYCLTFYGRLHEENSHVQEAPKVMLTPVAILAFLSIVGGLLGYSFTMNPSPLELMLAKVGIKKEQLTGSHVPLVLSNVGALFGLISAWVLYTVYLDRLKQTWLLLKQAFYIDDLYSLIVVRPLKAISDFIYAVFERRTCENSLHKTASLTVQIASWLQLAQNGQLRSYVAWMTFGAVFLIAYLML